MSSEPPEDEPAEVVADEPLEPEGLAVVPAVPEDDPPAEVVAGEGEMLPPPTGFVVVLTAFAVPPLTVPAATTVPVPLAISEIPVMAIMFAVISETTRISATNMPTSLNNVSLFIYSTPFSVY